MRFAFAAEKQTVNDLAHVSPDFIQYVVPRGAGKPLTVFVVSSRSQVTLAAARQQSLGVKFSSDYKKCKTADDLAVFNPVFIHHVVARGAARTSAVLLVSSSGRTGLATDLNLYLERRRGLPHSSLCASALARS